MKTPLLTFVLATSLAIFSLHADAGDKELKKGQVPQPVLDAFAKARPNAKVKEFEKDTKEKEKYFSMISSYYNLLENKICSLPPSLLFYIPVKDVI